MGIKTVPQPPYRPDLAPCDFWLFPKLRGFRYETIAEMKEAVTKVTDTITQEDFQKVLERYNKCIGGDDFEGTRVSIKVPIRKNVWKLIICTSYIEVFLGSSTLLTICAYITTNLNFFFFFFFYNKLVSV